ncbi:hypothetical protein CC80DRAFT_210276 [Byssothecium circinans]|uniref:Uncharacterized protein n=1 Tax=Byssothecium circinans TaxID=147558 RepID=A0A6A5TKJ0_9PLEO|nr:hypothetical protein CC80DRAFT_210276 [Byssothecium circinans]
MHGATRHTQQTALLTALSVPRSPLFLPSLHPRIRTHPHLNPNPNPNPPPRIQQTPRPVLRSPSPSPSRACVRACVTDTTHPPLPAIIMQFGNSAIQQFHHTQIPSLYIVRRYPSDQALSFKFHVPRSTVWERGCATAMAGRQACFCVKLGVRARDVCVIMYLHTVHSTVCQHFHTCMLVYAHASTRANHWKPPCQKKEPLRTSKDRQTYTYRSQKWKTTNSSKHSSRSMPCRSRPSKKVARNA